MPAATDDEKLLTIDDLATRWSCSPDVVRRHAKLDGLPHLALGRSAGRRPMLRFRLGAVKAWEAARERAVGLSEAGPAVALQAAPAG